MDQLDLSSVSEIFAIQINYADQDAEYLGKSSGVFHQYIIYGSIDGKKWEIMADKRNNHEDVPHDYIPLSHPKKYRYVKLENIKMPTGKFAISGFRIFGHGGMDKPDPVKNFMVLRTEKDKRSAWLKWNPVNNAYAYQIYYGTAPDKKYSSIMVYDQNEYWLKTLDALKTYYFSIEAINESGTSQQHPVVKSE